MVPETRLVCSGCGAREIVVAGIDTACSRCGATLRKPGRLERIVDGLLAPTAHVSPAYHRHVQLIQELWTANGRDQELYAALRPRMSLSKFAGQVTDLVIRGIEEGWIEVHIPVAPINDDAAYWIEFRDPDRFADEIALMFPAR